MAKREKKLFSVDGEKCVRMTKTFSSIVGVDEDSIIESKEQEKEVLSESSPIYGLVVVQASGESEVTFYSEDELVELESAKLKAETEELFYDFKVLEDYSKVTEWLADCGISKSEAEPSKKLFSDATEDLVSITKLYSVASITERVRVHSLSPKRRFRRILMEYKRYMTSKKDLSTEKRAVVQRLFTSDVMSIFNDLAPQVAEGGKINILLGASSVGSKEIASAARDLSLIYMRALKSEKALGDVPKAQYIKLSKAMENFFVALKAHVFDDDLGKEVYNQIPLK